MWSKSWIGASFDAWSHQRFLDKFAKIAGELKRGLHHHNTRSHNPFTVSISKICFLSSGWFYDGSMAATLRGTLCPCTHQMPRECIPVDVQEVHTRYTDAVKEVHTRYTEAVKEVHTRYTEATCSIGYRSKYEYSYRYFKGTSQPDGDQ